MPHIVTGLVGGVASGKSTVATLFAAERSGVCVDADALAHRILRRKSIKAAVARRIPGTLGGDGELDRRALARRVFRDPGARRALAELTHPPIRRAIENAIENAKARHVFLDAALLQEEGVDARCDWVVYVACPARVRRARARRGRGWTDREHRLREATQWPCRKKRARADLVVDNSGDRARTRREVRRAIRAMERSG